MKKIVMLLLGIIFIFLAVSCSAKQNNEHILKNITASEATEMIAKDKTIIVVDIRTKEEFDSGHIAGAINFDYYSQAFKSQIDSLNKTKSYIIYCRSGNRSGKAMVLFEELGFREVYNIADGIIGLNGINYPLVTN